MNSPEHLAAGSALAIAGYATTQWAQTLESPIVTIVPRVPALSTLPPTTVAIGIACYLIGCLLPDIDQKSSWLGRIVHLPIQHRTWTHALWVPIALILLSNRFWWCFPLALGYVAHLICDAPSRAGICWFYPYPGYRRYDSGAFVKKGNHIWLYHTGDRSERIVCIAICLISLAWAVATTAL